MYGLYTREQSVCIKRSPASGDRLPNGSELGHLPLLLADMCAELAPRMCANCDTLNAHKSPNLKRSELGARMRLQKLQTSIIKSLLLVDCRFNRHVGSRLARAMGKKWAPLLFPPKNAKGRH